jgi:hypothetical protein
MRVTKNHIASKAALWATLFALGIAHAQTIPTFTGPSLANETVHLPIAEAGARTVLVLGFSKKAGDACKPWFDAVAAQLKSKPQVAYYELPVLASAPGFIRGRIVHNIRGSLAPEQQKHFVPIMENAQAWKNAVSFSAPDDAYVVIVDERGSVIWRDSGLWSPQKEQELQAALVRL